jgi:hypothetical protein
MSIAVGVDLSEQPDLIVLVTAGCIDTGLPTGRRNFGQSVKTLIETANVHHARWVMFTETRCQIPTQPRRNQPLHLPLHP